MQLSLKKLVSTNPNFGSGIIYRYCFVYCSVDY